MHKRNLVTLAFGFVLFGCSDDGVSADGSADASGSSDTGNTSNTSATMSATDTSASMSASVSTTDADSSGTTEPTTSTSSESTDPSETASASSETSVSDSASSDSSASDSASSDGSSSDSASTGVSDSASTGVSDSMGTDSATSGPTTDSDSASSSSSTSDSDTGNAECVEIMCGNQLYECGDCEDNDGDNDVDAGDVECVSPCDDDESSFATGIPGDNMDPCLQDCFFDGNSGSGNDGCLWDLACDPASPGAPECPYNPDDNNCPGPQSEECYDNCAIPNGCDCFGCCEIVVDEVAYHVFIGDPNCSVETIEQCAECTPQESCFDPCEPEECEICFGEELPPEDCGEPQCTDGQQSCLMTADCPEGFFCQTGCCEGLE